MMNANTRIPFSATSLSAGRLGRILCFLIAMVLMIPSLGGAQYYPASNYQTQLNQNIAQQNNLKNNINFLMKLREQARGQAQLARTAGDRGAFDHWAGQYRQLQGRINEFQMRLRQLEGEEQNIRTAMSSGNSNPYQRSGQGGGKPMIPGFSAQNRGGTQGWNSGGAGVSPGPATGGTGTTGGGGYIPPRSNDPNNVNLLDQSAGKR
jgi:hypothetical protein